LYKENPFYNVDEIIDATLRIPFVASKGSLQLLQMLLSKSPDKRPTAEQALDHPWLND
jgi:serine/threonine protein kinase